MPEDSEQYFSNPLDLATRLLSFISLCRNLTSKHLSEISIQKLISNSFAVIIEASMHDSRVWDAVEQSTQIKDLIFTLLLRESRQGIRKSVAEIIFATCGTTPSQKRAWKASSQVKGGAVAVVGRLPSATTIHIVATLWKHISALFPDTLEYAQSSQEFFEVALTVFQTVANLSPEDLIYGEYLRKWGDILLSHRTNEVCFSIPFPILCFYIIEHIAKLSQLFLLVRWSRACRLHRSGIHTPLENVPRAFARHTWHHGHKVNIAIPICV